MDLEIWRHRAAFADAVLRYDPRQPRDRGGQWTDGPGADLSKPNVDMTPDERAFLSDYVEDGRTFREVNSALRGDGEVTPEMAEKIAKLDDLTGRATLDGDATLYRAMSLKTTDPLMSAVARGGTWTDLGYGSVSGDRDAVEDFQGSGPYNAVIFEIAAKKGQPVLVLGDDLSDTAMMQTAQEALLPRGYTLTWKASGMKRVNGVPTWTVKATYDGVQPQPAITAAFNPNQRRGPDGKWIKMGGRGPATPRPRLDPSLVPTAERHAGDPHAPAVVSNPFFDEVEAGKLYDHFDNGFPADLLKPNWEDMEASEISTLPINRYRIADLIHTQDWITPIDPDHVSWDPNPPVVYKMPDGSLYLLNGHHHVMQAILRGREMIGAREYSIENGIPRPVGLSFATGQAVFGFNPNQRRGPDGKWIKMGGAALPAYRPVKPLPRQGAIFAEGWMHGDTPAERAPGFWQGRFGDQRAIRDVFRNINAGREPMDGINLDRGFNATYLRVEERPPLGVGWEQWEADHPDGGPRVYDKDDLRDELTNAALWLRESLADAPATRQPLYRGLRMKRGDIPAVGDTWDSDVISWAEDRGWAEHYAGIEEDPELGRVGEMEVVLKLAGPKRSVDLGPELLDEHLTSGRYRVTRVSGKGRKRFVTVEEVQP